MQRGQAELVGEAPDDADDEEVGGGRNKQPDRAPHQKPPLRSTSSGGKKEDVAGGGYGECLRVCESEEAMVVERRELFLFLCLLQKHTKGTQDVVCFLAVRRSGRIAPERTWGEHALAK
eukprot:3489795-Rhodomonas_salina.1